MQALFKLFFKKINLMFKLQTLTLKKTETIYETKIVKTKTTSSA